MKPGALLSGAVGLLMAVLSWTLGRSVTRLELLGDQLTAVVALMPEHERRLSMLESEMREVRSR